MKDFEHLSLPENGLRAHSKAVFAILNERFLFIEHKKKEP